MSHCLVSDSSTEHCEELSAQYGYVELSIADNVLQSDSCGFVPRPMRVIGLVARYANVYSVLFKMHVFE